MEDNLKRLLESRGFRELDPSRRNALMKQRIIKLLGGKCSNPACQVKFRKVPYRRPPKPGGSYRRKGKRSNLELHHSPAVLDQGYRWRLGNFDLPIKGKEDSSRYLRRWCQELSSCVLLCTNCHKKVTGQERQVISEKRMRPSAQCKLNVTTDGRFRMDKVSVILPNALG
jgi:hypothetical protein